MEATIKPCKPSDLKLLVQLARTTFLESFGAVNKPADMQDYLDEAFSVDRLSSELNSENSQFYFAYLGDHLAGYIKLNTGSAQTEPQPEPSLEVERIYVLNQFQGKRLGQELMEKAFRLAKKEGLTYIWLGVWEHNHAAIQFYKSKGFEKFGEHPFLLGQDRQIDHLMRLKLS